MKRFQVNLTYYVLIVFAALIACFQNVSSKLHNASDIYFHLSRLISTVHAFNDGQWLPQFDPSAAKGFGYAYNEFYGPLPNYFIVLLRGITPSWPVAINLFFILCTITAGILCFHFVRYLLQGRKYDKISALLAAFLLIFGQETATNVYYFFGFGPHMGTSFVILLFFGLTRLFDKNDKKSVLMLILGMAGIPLTHTLLTLIAIPFAALYFVILFFSNRRKIKIKSLLINSGISILIAVGLSAFFTFPLLENLMTGYYNISNPAFTTRFSWNVKDHFTNNWNLFSTIFKDARGPSFVLLLLFFALFIFLYLKKRLTREAVIFSSLFFISLLFGLQGPQWNLIPAVFYQLQFPERLFVLTGIFFPISFGMLLGPFLASLREKKFRLRFFMILCLLIPIVFFVKISERPAEQKTVFTTDIHKIQTKSSYWDLAVGEYFPTQIINLRTTFKEVSSWYDRIKPKAANDDYLYVIQVRDGINHRGNGIALLNNAAAKISHIQRNGSKTTFSVSSNPGKTSLELADVFYPGFKATITSGGKTSSLQPVLSKHGLVQLNLPVKFDGTVKVYFGMSRGSVLGVVATLLSFAGLLAFVFWKKINSIFSFIRLVPKLRPDSQ